MTSSQQRAALQRQIWQIANDVRGAVDGWDFKQYVLGTLFYRFISESFASYIEGGDENIHYAELADSVITPEIKDDASKTKGSTGVPRERGRAPSLPGRGGRGSRPCWPASQWRHAEASAAGTPAWGCTPRSPHLCWDAMGRGETARNKKNPRQSAGFRGFIEWGGTR